MKTFFFCFSISRYSLLSIVFACANIGIISPVSGQTTYTYIPTSGATNWVDNNNWDLDEIPDGVDVTAVLQATGGGVTNTHIASPGIDLGHLEIDVSGGSWGIGGVGPIRWTTSGATLPTLTIHNTLAFQGTTISTALANPTTGTPKALEIKNTATSVAGGVISFTGNNTAFTGGFNLSSTTNMTVAFLYENSLATNTVNILAGNHNVRLGAGAVHRTFSSDFTVASGAMLIINANASPGGNSILTGTISGDGGVDFRNYAGGDLSLQGANTYTGNTIIALGLKLHFDGVDNFGTGNTITFAPSSTGASPTLIWLEGNTDDLTKKADGTTRTINLQRAEVTFNVGSNDVTLANAITGLASSGAMPGSGIIKEGTGTLRVLADNDWKTNTIVKTGALLTNNTAGSATGDSAVTVEANATLGGIGFILPVGEHSIQIKTDAILSPGDGGVGNLTLDLSNTTGTLNFEDASILAVDLGDAFSADLLTLAASTSESVVFSGNTKINLLNASTGGLEEGDYQLFSAANNNVYSGLTVLEGEITGGLVIDQNLTGFDSSLWLDNGDIYVRLSAIPEPGSIVLLGLALCGVAFRRRA